MASEVANAPEIGRQALRILDKLLAERPEKVGHDFSEASRWLTGYRDELIAVWRRTGAERDRERLARVNAVLSVVLGGHFPLGGVPWQHIEQARKALSAVLGAGK